MSGDPERVLRVLVRLGVDVVRHRGGRAWALCPYHDDHEPNNWMIRTVGERAGQHTCFACKAGGTLFDLVMHTQGYASPASALEFLRGHEEAPSPPRDSVRVELRPHRRRRFRLPEEVILDPLAEWVTPARDRKSVV